MIGGSGLNYPTGVGMDRVHQILYIADRGNNCIRRWDGKIGGAVSTVAGNCELGEWGYVDGADGRCGKRPCLHTSNTKTTN